MKHDLSQRQRIHEATVQEIAQEKAASLGRAGRRLERALHELRTYSIVHGDDDPRRLELIEQAGEALFFYVVQREACGLRDTAALMRELEVPRDVQLHMGLRRAR